MMIPRLEGAGVRLRPAIPEDAATLAAAFPADTELGRLIGVETDPDEADLRQQIASAPARAAAGNGLTMTIAARSDDTCLGSLIVHSIDERHRRCEIGIYLVPAARGRGAATAAMRTVIAWLFSEQGMERIE